MQTELGLRTPPKNMRQIKDREEKVVKGDELTKAYKEIDNRRTKERKAR